MLVFQKVDSMARLNAFFDNFHVGGLLLRDRIDSLHAAQRRIGIMSGSIIFL